tara:strand:- start:140 stop:2140 length:2001 start_codon:yes stop_codon:yes gene_type:complete
MADVNKSVEISYRADIKQLTKTLKQGGKLSEKQIKEMIGGLNKQLKQTERAAQKAGNVSAKSMKKIELSAKKATIEVDELHDSAGDVGSVMGQIAGAVGMLNPELEGMATATADAVGGLEALAGIGKFINPAFATFAIVAGAAAYVMSEYSAEQERAAKTAEELAEEQERLNQKLKDYKKIQEDTIGSLGAFTAELNMAQAEVAMLSGEISKAEFASMKNQIEANKIAEELKNTAQERVDALRGEQKIKERILQMTKDELQDLIQNRKGSEGITAELAKRAEKKEQIKKLEAELEQFAVKRAYLEEQVNLDYAGQAEQLISLKDKAEELKEQEAERKRLAEQRRKEQEKEKDNNEELKAQQARLLEIQRGIDRVTAEGIKAQQDINKMTAKRVGGEAVIKFEYEQQLQALKDQESSLLSQIEKSKVLAETDEERLLISQLEKDTAKSLQEIEDLRTQKRIEAIENIEKLREEAHKKELDREEKERVTRLKNYDEFTNAITGFADSAITLNQNIFKNDAEAQKKLFKLSQASAIANIAFEASKAIASKLALPPGIRGAQIAAIIAGAAAQTSTVMAQSPPTADMGGMIGNNDRLRPDETMVRVLQGEAVLDRATTERIGGQEGIQRLQERGTAGQVVVVQPFKHFDRFIKQSTTAGRINYNKSQTRY